MRGLVPVILIALSAGIFIYYIQPEYKSVQALQAEQIRYDEALEAADELSIIRDDLLTKYNSFSTADLRRIRKFLPKQVDDVRLILDVNNIAEDNGFEIEEIELENLEENGDRRSVERTASNPEGLDTLSLSFSFDSNYQSFLNFITDLESSLRIIDITELSFEADQDQPGIYSFSITLQTYWLK